MPAHRPSAIRTAAARPITAALVYRSGDRCPACWGTHWLIGRQTAECARCGMALAINACAAELAAA